MASSTPRRTARPYPAVSEIPLRLRIRRDGTLALTGPAGDVDDPSRAFPSSFLFQFSWLLANAAHVTVDAPNDAPGGQLRVNLVNATATYGITGQTPAGYLCELLEQKLTKAPPIDEKKAAAIRAERGDV